MAAPVRLVMVAAAAAALAACRVPQESFVFTYPGTDTSAPAFKTDAKACRYDAVKATAAVRDDTLQLFRRKDVYEACMRARDYKVTSKYELI